MQFAGISRRLLIISLLPAALVAADSVSDTAAEARRELFTGHSDFAAKLYARVVAAEPSSGDAWYGLVRSQLEGHHPKEAQASADDALKKAPGTPGAETAAGMADWRSGQLNDSIKHFGAALKLDPKYAGALAGMAVVESALAKSRTARDLWTRAWMASPDDPALIAAHSASSKGTDQIAGLEKALAGLDPASDAGRSFQTRLATARALVDTKVGRLVSPYQNSTIRLYGIFTGRPMTLNRLTVHVVLNGRVTVALLLDTGASGIAIAPSMAEKAGLTRLADVAGEATGFGTMKPLSIAAYMAKEVRVGDVTFADCPVQAFAAAQSVDYDGVIGADVFERFLVKIDFPKQELVLQTRATNAEEVSEIVDRSDTPPPGFVPVMRFGAKLAIATTLNNSPGLLFLIDSGSTVSLLDEDTAKRFAFTTGSAVAVRGVQGKTSNGSLANQVTLTFAGIRQEDYRLLSIDMGNLSEDMGTQFGGLIGFRTLNELVLTIDYREGLVRFEHR